MPHHCLYALGNFRSASQERCFPKTVSDNEPFNKVKVCERKIQSVTPVWLGYSSSITQSEIKPRHYYSQQMPRRRYAGGSVIWPYGVAILTPGSSAGGYTRGPMRNSGVRTVANSLERSAAYIAVTYRRQIITN